MTPADEDNKRKIPSSNHFNHSEEFKKIYEEMRRIIEKVFNESTIEWNMMPGKSFVYGFKIHIDETGKPQIEEFGNRPHRTASNGSIVSMEREPLTEVIDIDDEIGITMELPGVEKEDIKVLVHERCMEVKVDTPGRKFHKVIDLPHAVKPRTIARTFQNGLLDVLVEKKYKKRERIS